MCVSAGHVRSPIVPAGEAVMNITEGQTEADEQSSAWDQTADYLTVSWFLPSTLVDRVDLACHVVLRVPAGNETNNTHIRNEQLSKTECI